MNSPQKVSAGITLLQPGKLPTELILLHEGEAAVYSKWAGRDRRRLYTIASGILPGFSALLTRQEYPAFCITTKESLISRHTVGNSYNDLILKQVKVGLSAIHSLLKETASSYQTIHNLTHLLALIQKVSDNFAIAYGHCNPAAFAAEPSDLRKASLKGVKGVNLDAILSAARVTMSEYEQNGGRLPQAITSTWLQGDYSSILQRNYLFNSNFDLQDFHLIRNILLLPTNIQHTVYQANIRILEGLSQKLAKAVHQNIDEIYQLQSSIDNGMEDLVSGEDCYAEKFYSLLKEAGNSSRQVNATELHEIIGFFNKRVKNFLDYYKSQQGIPYPELSPAFEKLQQSTGSRIGQGANQGIDLKKDLLSNSASQATADPKAGISVGIDMEGVIKDLENSAGKIMSFLKFDSTRANALLNNLEKIRKFENPLEVYGQVRQLRKEISKDYWEIWQRAYHLYQEQKGKVPIHIKMLLLYGFFDEKFLNNDHLHFLYNCSDNSSSSYPVYNVIEWISRIENRQEPPSINELGLSYFAKLKRDNPSANWKKESDLTQDVDRPEKRANYEIKNFLETVSKLTSGSPVSFFPILNRNQITIPLDKCFITKAELSRRIDQLLQIDFSAFHREVLFNDEAQGIVREFIQVQVVPNIIIVPSIGAKIMMWQELSGYSKSSRGRIAVPVFTTTDIYTILIEAIAAFRWELTKSIMGADWNNVGQPSITSDYTDYVQFFKKNRGLSIQIKEKLANDFKRLRNDKDRFAHDYVNWIKHESGGILRLNKVAREIFFRHIPFEKSIREKLRDHPVFADIYTRFSNIRNRKLKELEVRYHKYGEDLPEALKKNHLFYSI